MDFQKLEKTLFTSRARRSVSFCRYMDLEVWHLATVIQLLSLKVSYSDCHKVMQLQHGFQKLQKISFDLIYMLPNVVLPGPLSPLKKATFGPLLAALQESGLWCVKVWPLKIVRKMRCIKWGACNLFMMQDIALSLQSHFCWTFHF